MASTRRTTGRTETFTAEERAAMKERAQEVKASARRSSRADKAAEDEAAVVTKIAEMQDADRVMAERIHAVVKENAPGLAPKLWYGMPAYAKDGVVLCFFQSAAKFKSRYATLGFSDKATLDDGSLWPNAYAVIQIGDAEEAQIRALIRRAVG
jgi:uncharacterized protein YdhG (YjbR/CyaY superfamily)